MRYEDLHIDRSEVETLELVYGDDGLERAGDEFNYPADVSPYKSPGLNVTVEVDMSHIEEAAELEFWAFPYSEVVVNDDLATELLEIPETERHKLYETVEREVSEVFREQEVDVSEKALDARHRLVERAETRLEKGRQDVENVHSLLANLKI